MFPFQNSLNVIKQFDTFSIPGSNNTNTNNNIHYNNPNSRHNPNNLSSNNNISTYSINNDNNNRGNSGNVTNGMNGFGTQSLSNSQSNSSIFNNLVMNMSNGSNNSIPYSKNNPAGRQIEMETPKDFPFELDYMMKQDDTGNTNQSNNNSNNNNNNNNILNAPKPINKSTHGMISPKELDGLHKLGASTIGTNTNNNNTGKFSLNDNTGTNTLVSPQLNATLPQFNYLTAQSMTMPFPLSNSNTGTTTPISASTNYLNATSLNNLSQYGTSIENPINPGSTGSASVANNGNGSGKNLIFSSMSPSTPTFPLFQSMQSHQQQSHSRIHPGQHYNVHQHQNRHNQLQLQHHQQQQQPPPPNYVIGSDRVMNSRTNSYDLTLVQQLYMDKPLMEHISKKQKRGYYKCTHCPETFPTIFDYAKHMDDFRITRDFKCPFTLCPWKVLGLPRRSDLRRHCAIQHKDELPNDLKQELNLHDEMYPILHCPYDYCDKLFIRRDSYNRHISIVHEKPSSRFNKRLKQILQDCPEFQADKERDSYVKYQMKNFKRRQRLTRA